MTEYTPLTTPESVRAALERGEPVEIRSRVQPSSWWPLGESWTVDRIAEYIDAGYQFRAPLPAVQASDAEDVRFLVAYTIPHPIREFIVSRLVERGWLTDEHTKPCELTPVGERVVARALAATAAQASDVAADIVTDGGLLREWLAIKRCLASDSYDGIEQAYVARMDDVAAATELYLAATPAAAVPAAGDWVAENARLVADPRNFRPVAYEHQFSSGRNVLSYREYDDRIPEANRVRPLLYSDTMLAVTPAPPEKASKVVLRPLGWSELDKDEWVDDSFGFHITIDNDEPQPFVAAWGEGDPEYFATLDEAKAWCHDELTRWISSVVDIVPHEKSKADGSAAIAESNRRMATLKPHPNANIERLSEPSFVLDIEDAPAKTREAVADVFVRVNEQGTNIDTCTNSPTMTAREMCDWLKANAGKTFAIYPATPGLLARLHSKLIHFAADVLQLRTWGHAMDAQDSGKLDDAALALVNRIKAEADALIAGAQK